jgi:BolA family transcriptional regulator, general stress-responsive regulator
VQTSDNPGMQNRQDRLRAELTAAFAPTLLEIVDDSAGHTGAAAGGETHYNIKMISEAFAGQSRVERSRAVHQVLAGKFASGLHALSLSLSAR